MISDKVRATASTVFGPSYDNPFLGTVKRNRSPCCVQYAVVEWAGLCFGIQADASDLWLTQSQKSNMEPLRSTHCNFLDVGELCMKSYCIVCRVICSSLSVLSTLGCNMPLLKPPPPSAEL